MKLAAIFSLVSEEVKHKIRFWRHFNELQAAGSLEYLVVFLFSFSFY